MGNTSYMPVNKDDVRGSHIINIDNPVFNITKFKRDGTSKTRAVSKLFESSNNLNFYTGKRKS